jgi:multiple antibiotic resistance protein
MNFAAEVAKNVFLIVSALFPIVDPLGGSPIFLSLTSRYPSTARWTLSRSIAVNSFFLLVGSYFIGTHVLAFFGISIPVVQLGGGLVVISTGWAMLKRGDDEDHDARKDVTCTDLSRQAFYPLTLPLTVGPGSISVAITLGANAPRHLGYNPALIAASIVGMALIAVSILVCYGFADRLSRALGATAMNVIVRLSSFLLLCIGIQILWNGVKALLATLPRA